MGSGNRYLKTACDYVHLNPVRAHLLGSEDGLLAYPWSSFGWYLAAPEHRPGWMRVDRLFGEHGIAEELAIAVRLRNETTLPVKWIAARVQIGTAKWAKSVLHRPGREQRQHKPAPADQPFWVGTAFSGVDLPPDVAGAGSDFEALEELRRLAFADQVEPPQQLLLWQADAGQTEKT